MHAEPYWALPSGLSKPSGACPSPFQVHEIYGWSDFLITVSPSACWPLAPLCHLSPSPTAPARSTAPFPPWPLAWGAALVPAVPSPSHPGWDSLLS